MSDNLKLNWERECCGRFVGKDPETGEPKAYARSVGPLGKFVGYVKTYAGNTVLDVVPIARGLETVYEAQFEAERALKLQ